MEEGGRESRKESLLSMRPGTVGDGGDTPVSFASAPQWCSLCYETYHQRVRWQENPEKKNDVILFHVDVYES